jgi:hypothetical protein
MLSDKFFIPLFLLAISAAVYGAFAYGPRPSEASNPLGGDPLAGFLIEGDGLRLLRSGPGLTLDFSNEEDGTVIASTAAGQPPNQGLQSAGTFLTFLPEIGSAWAGHTVFANFEMRMPEIHGSSDAYIRYYAIDLGNGVPVPCPLTTNWSQCSISHPVPTTDKPPNLHFLGVWPDTKGLSRYVEIRKIQISIDQPVNQPDQPDPATGSDQ